MSHRHDYYVTAQQPEYPNEIYERHAGLTDEEADELLAELQARGYENIMVEPSTPEWYTIGLEETLVAIIDTLNDWSQDEDEE